MPVFISNNKVGRTYITMDCYMPVGMRPCVSACPAQAVLVALKPCSSLQKPYCMVSE